MLTMKPIVFAAVLAVGQAWIVPQQACDTRRTPAPGADPWANVPVSETATTADGVRIGVQVLVTNVEVPWSLVFAPDGRLFFTERDGRVRVIQNGQLLPQPALTLDDVRASGEGGLLGMALHPDFASNRYVYLAYTGFRSDGVAVNRIARFRESNNVLGERAILVDNITASGAHNGARVRFGPDRKLYVTMGDAAQPALSQSLSSLNGKILRLNDDGTTPADNPYGSPVWTWGHRHPQGIDWHPATGQAWATEHGDVGNDELNLLTKGTNYGWPTIEGAATRPDMATPVLFFSPSIAPSGLSFYDSVRIPQFRANIFFAALRGMHIHRVRLDPADATKVIAAERLFELKFGRIRDVITGPDGALYFCTSNRDGRTPAVASDDRIARIVPIQ